MRHFRRSQDQRGVMAVLTALFASVMTIFMVVLIETLFMVQDKREATHTADAIADAFGDQMVIWKMPLNFSASNLRTDDIAKANYRQSLTKVTATGPYLLQPLLGPADHADAYTPVFVNILVDAGPKLSVISALVPKLIGSKIPDVQGYSAARVNQVNLAHPYLIRERVELLLDFSASMRLPYEGPNAGAYAGQSAASVVRTAARSMIDYYGSDIFDLGISMFGDTGMSETLNPMGKQASDPTALNTHLTEMRNMVSSTPTWQSDTDMASALSNAVTSMNQAGMKTDPFFGTQRVILVSDGEPDSGSGIDKSKPLAQRTAAADAHTVSVMQSAWTNQNIISDVFFMQHLTQTDEEREKASEFMRSIAGQSSNNKAQANIKNYSDDGGDPGALLNFLNSLPLVPYCRFSPLSQMPRPSDSVPNHLLPRTGDRLFGYFSQNWDPRSGSGQEIPIPASNTFVDQRQAFVNWSLMQNATRTPGSGNIDPRALGDSQRMAFYYDSDAQVVYLSSWLCLAFVSQQNTGGNTMRFRMRWAAPHLVDPNFPMDR